MPILCTPTRLKFEVADATELKHVLDVLYPGPADDVPDAEKQKYLNDKAHLLSNLKALCGFGVQKPRENMHQINDYALLEKVVWLRKRGDPRQELVPLVGSPEWAYSSVLQPRTDVSFALSSLKKLAPPRGGKPKLDHVGKPHVWEVAPQPLELAQSLPDGAHLSDVNLINVVTHPQVSMPAPRSY